MSYLLYDHILVHYFFDNDDSEVVETVIRCLKVLVNTDHAVFFGIVTMLVNPTICFLGFYFSDVLLRIAFLTEGQLNDLNGMA